MGAELSLKTGGYDDRSKRKIVLTSMRKWRTRGGDHGEEVWSTQEILIRPPWEI